MKGVTSATPSHQRLGLEAPQGKKIYSLGLSFDKKNRRLEIFKTFC